MTKTSKRVQNKVEGTKTQLKTTTPIDRKLRKVRVNIKKSVKYEEKASSICQQRSESVFKIRPCFVKLKRVPTKTFTSSSVALQAQCQVNNNNKFNKKTKNEALFLREDETNGIVKSTRTRRKYVDTDCKTLQNNNVAEISEVLKQISKNTAAKTTAVNSKVDENNSDLQSINANLNGSTLSKLTVATKARNQNPDPILSASTKSTENIRTRAVTASSTPYSNKICIIRLQKCSTTSKRKTPLVEIPSNKTKNCVVRIKKTPTSKIHTHSEHANSGAMNISGTIPVIDDSKRRDFRKLSLTKSFRKWQEHIETENIKNIKFKNDYQKKTQETLNSNKNTDSTNDKENQLHNHKITELKNIKLNPKLSLRKQNVLRNKNIQCSEVKQFEMQQNSMMFFEPVRNSTLLEIGSKKSNHQKNSKEVCEKTTPSKDKSSSRNLANKSEEIEDLLHSLDDEEEIPLNSKANKNENNCQIKESKNNLEAQNNNTTTTNKTNKFFHRNKEDVNKNNLKEPNSQKTKFAKPKVTKKRRFQTKRSIIVRPENIYEFLSQSQTSDSDGAKHIDATADIIKKLIAQGKVRVATNCKGTGKPKFKRKKPRTRQNKRIQQIANKQLQEIKNKTKNKPLIEESKGNSSEEDHHFLDHFDDIEIPTRDIVSNRTNNNECNNPANDQEGTFSRLARRVLINQAGRSNVEARNASKLLEMVKEIVSTPKNNNIIRPQAILESDLSPIAIPPPRSAANTSPWRVNEDSYLPKTFNFNRSSGNLPSFSSDVVTCTPRKKKIKIQNSHQTKFSSSPKQNLITNITSIQTTYRDGIQPHAPILNAPSTLSSFSSNDSNAENIAPPKNTSENYNENDGIFDLKQFPNPRRALNCRSPLKTINILEVVHLPPYKPGDKEIHTEDVVRDEVAMFDDVCFQRDTSVVEDNDVQNNNTSEKTKNLPKENLFGFEDFLSQTEFSSQEYNHEMVDINTTLPNCQNLTIHQKLQDLQKLKPRESEPKQISKDNPRNAIKNMPLFDYTASNKDGMRQKDIKEMLCSTMLNTEPSTSKDALRMLNNRNFKYKKLQNCDEDSDLSELFKDNEPETSLNENDDRRTYMRPYKRKRRLKETKYLITLASDESENEEDSHEQIKHDSHESNISLDHPTTKKTNRKKAKKNQEDIKFIEEFNALVKEVEGYKLIVEKTT